MTIRYLRPCKKSQNITLGEGWTSLLQGNLLNLRRSHNIGSIQALGALLAFKLNRIPLVQSLIAIRLNGGEVNKDIFSS